VTPCERTKPSFWSEYGPVRARKSALSCQGVTVTHIVICFNSKPDDHQTWCILQMGGHHERTTAHI